MKYLSSFYGKQLEFTQPSVWKTYYELKCDEQTLGTVKKIKKFSFQLEINIFNNKWIFYRPSFWRSEIAIRQSGYTLPYAKYKGGKFKQHGMIELPKGGRVKIVFKAFKKDYEIQDSSGQVLVKLADKVKFRTTVEISVMKRSELIDKYPWIIILAWYISALRKHAAAAAG
jgi:hypothetical protein